MTIADHEAVQREKRELRRRIRPLRRRLSDKEERSRRIMRHLAALDAFRSARCVLFYVDMQDEVRTRGLLAETLDSGKRVAVTYCVEGRLEPVSLESIGELRPGAYGILEPSEQVRSEAGRRVDPKSIDAVLVPGIAFDRRGGRLGQGKGYYDKLLADVRPNCWKIGLAYDCQIAEAVPAARHDVRMDAVVTETALYCTRSQ